VIDRRMFIVSIILIIGDRLTIPNLLDINDPILVLLYFPL
jgi:hypothetical protein